jgi:glycosyltransferase involved in cell wall biosynthesis
MRILIVTQYFWPENFKINDIALALKERGHEVLVLTGKPNYPNGKFSKGYTFFNKRIEFWNGIKIYRSPIIPRGKGKGIELFVNYISFSIFASIKLLFIKNKFDKIFVYEPSPITVGIPGIVAKYKFKAPLYFWVQDLWPESISAAGGIKNKSVIAVLDWFTRFIYKHSKKVLVQSKAFIPYILNQNTENDKLVYYPNSTENYYKELSTDQELLKTLPKGIKLMFAGNIGEAQSFDTLLKTASILKKELIDVKWIILGDGRMKGYVNQKIKELNLGDNFYLLGAFPSTEMPKYFSCADALVVSLKKDPIFALTIPSKIQSYLACGKPIITSLDGEGSKIIEEANAGFTSPSEDCEGLVANIKKFLTLSNEEQKTLGQNGRAYFNIEFEREILIDRLEKILDND